MNGLAGAKGFVLVGGRTTWWNLMNVFETRGTQPRDRKNHTFFLRYNDCTKNVHWEKHNGTLSRSLKRYL